MGDNKSDKKYSREIVLAKWEDRFVAWLIDFVIISIIIGILFYIFSVDYSFPFWGISIDGDDGVGIRQPYEYIVASSIFFLYWVILEFLTGETIGKRVVHIKTTNLYGGRPSIINIAIEVFGKRSELIASQHRFSLERYEGKTGMGVGRFPFPVQVRAVNLCVRCRAGPVRTERRGDARQQRLRVREVK